MGRKAGPTKWTKVFRITPDDDRKLEEILQFWQRSKGFYNMKTYTRSDVVGQAVRQYWLQQKGKGRNGWQTLWHMWQSNK